MEIEYERTYLLKYLPKNLENYPNKEYLDIYIPKNAEHPVLRMRKKGENYEMTKKYPVTQGDASIQHEFTIPLTNAEFEELEGHIRGKRTRKIRYLYKFKGILAEIDIFQDDLKGLALADIEFPSEQKKANFSPPDFCLAEVTQEKVVAGGMIVGKKYSEIAPTLAKYGYKPLFLE